MHKLFAPLPVRMRSGIGRLFGQCSRMRFKLLLKATGSQDYGITSEHVLLTRSKMLTANSDNA